MTAAARNERELNFSFRLLHYRMVLGLFEYSIFFLLLSLSPLQQDLRKTNKFFFSVKEVEREEKKGPWFCVPPAESGKKKSRFLLKEKNGKKKKKTTLNVRGSGSL